MPLLGAAWQGKMVQGRKTANTPAEADVRLKSCDTLHRDIEA